MVWPQRTSSGFFGLRDRATGRPYGFAFVTMETAHDYRGPNRSNAALKIGKAATEHRLPASDASQHLSADGAGTPDLLGRRNRHST